MPETRTRPGQFNALGIFKLSLVFVLGSAAAACSPADPDLLPLVLNVPSRSMTKLPFVIAEDQGLYEKHGLDVELRMSPPEFEGGRNAQLDFWSRVWRRLGLREFRQNDIFIDGHTPVIVEMTRTAGIPKRIALAATDCSVRYYVVGRPGISRLEELKGKRLGINADRSTAGFSALRMIERMGWDRDLDISVMRPGGFDSLRDGLVDAVVGGDGLIEAAEREGGYPVLVDTRVWNDQLAGNSILVHPEWLDDETNREAARRFLKATVEALALFHQRPELVLDVMARWNGITDRELAETRYERADYLPRKPYPCREGIQNTLALYDSNEMRRYAAEDLYDDSFIRELDESGFIDSLYN